MEIPRGWSVLKAKKESMRLNWNFQRGGGFKPKNLLWERYGYFLEQRNKLIHVYNKPLSDLLLIESRDGAVVRMLASHQCGPGSIP